MGGHGSEFLCEVRRKLVDKIKHTYHNNVIGVLRHYLYQLQPQDLITKSRLPKLEVKANGRIFTYNMELRDMTKPWKS